MDILILGLLVGLTGEKLFRKKIFLRIVIFQNSPVDFLLTNLLNYYTKKYMYTKMYKLENIVTPK